MRERAGCQLEDVLVLARHDLVLGRGDVHAVPQGPVRGAAVEVPALDDGQLGALRLEQPAREQRVAHEALPARINCLEKDVALEQLVEDARRVVLVEHVAAQARVEHPEKRGLREKVPEALGEQGKYLVLEELPQARVHPRERLDCACGVGRNVHAVDEDAHRKGPSARLLVGERRCLLVEGCIDAHAEHPDKLRVRKREVAGGDDQWDAGGERSFEVVFRQHAAGGEHQVHVIWQRGDEQRENGAALLGFEQVGPLHDEVDPSALDGRQA